MAERLLSFMKAGMFGETASGFLSYCCHRLMRILKPVLVLRAAKAIVRIRAVESELYPGEDKSWS